MLREINGKKLSHLELSPKFCLVCRALEMAEKEKF